MQERETYKRLAELLFQTKPVPFAQLQFGAVGEEHLEFAMRARRKLPDAIEIDERGTVNPHEPQREPAEREALVARSPESAGHMVHLGPVGMGKGFGGSPSSRAPIAVAPTASGPPQKKIVNTPTDSFRSRIFNGES